MKKLTTLTGWLVIAASFIAGIVSCNTLDDPTTTDAPNTYTMTVTASKGDATTRALSLDGKTLNATWAKGEQVEVYKGSDHLGTLAAASDGGTTTLTGTIDGEIAVNDDLTLKFLSPYYNLQYGTLEWIAANCDYALATVRINAISGGSVSTTDAVFENQQAIVKFTLLDAANDESLNAEFLRVTIESANYRLYFSSSVVYVAIPQVDDKTVSLYVDATGNRRYRYSKEHATLLRGQYYEITVKMEEQTIVYPIVGQVIGSNGRNYNYADLPSGVTAVAKICYVSGSNGLALALADEGQMDWSTAVSTCAAHTTALPCGTWKLASKGEWDQMISASGGYDALRDGFESVGGTNMQSAVYWSSTESATNDAAYRYNFADGSWINGMKNQDVYVRACLAF